MVVAQRREIDALRREAKDAGLLLDALAALLDDDARTDPFAGVFEVLKPMFGFSEAVVLAERDGPGSRLECVVSSPAHVAIADCDGWSPGQITDKVLGGGTSATLVGHCLSAEHPHLSGDQPALCLPLGVGERRGLMMLARPVDADGFDRSDVALGRKISLLASHALAHRAARGIERERRRLHDLTERLTEAQRELSYRANHDILTDLPNRAYLEEHVAEVLAERGEDDTLALAFIDLDGFKQVNDLYGHEVGDGPAGGAVQSRAGPDPVHRRAGSDQRRRVRAAGQSGAKP